MAATGVSRATMPGNDAISPNTPINFFDDEAARKGETIDKVDPMGDALLAMSQSLYERVAAGGDINEVLDAAITSFGDSIGQSIMTMMAEAMPGVGGMILGAGVGGLAARAFGGMFKTKGNKPEKTPIPVEVMNLPQLLQPWTLPSSNYFNPSGSNRGAVTQVNNNSITVTANPQIAKTVQRALTAPGYRRQLERAMV